MRLAVGVVFLLLLSGVPCSGVAHAESGPLPCVAGTPWPAAGSIPANQPAFVVRAPYGGVGEPILELWQTVGDGPETLVPSERTQIFETPGFVVLTPSESFSIGARVELRGYVCGTDRLGTEPDPVGLVQVEYDVSVEEATPPAPPLRLETRVSGVAEEGYYAGFYAEVTMHAEGGGLLLDWAPWVVPVIAIDDFSANPRPNARRVDASFPLACHGTYGVTPGSRLVVGALTTRAGDTLHELREEHVFDCDDARFVDAVTGEELTAEEVARLRPRPMDAGVPVRDASTPTDAGSFDAGVDEAAEGGGCHVAPTGGSSVTWLLAVVLGWRRRRGR
ncbi:MAG: hypothetical protein KC586_07750 [Myxococcales bacterium]|nr:hypothetical protein [Myxococcales bacterium]